jgi:hypothetical protein
MTQDERDGVKQALIELIPPLEAFINDKGGAPGFLLARLTDAHNALKSPAPNNAPPDRELSEDELAQRLHADFAWVGARHYTKVNPKAVRSRNPGFCFMAAGWRRCGMTKGGLIILERDAQAAIGNGRA